MDSLRKFQEVVEDATVIGAADWVREQCGDEIPGWAMKAIDRLVAEARERRNG